MKEHQNIWFYLGTDKPYVQHAIMYVDKKKMTFSKWCFLYVYLTAQLTTMAKIAYLCWD